MEHHLSGLLPSLRARGHTVSLLYEIDAPVGRTGLDEKFQDQESWQIGKELKSVLDRVARWQPDVVYLHGMQSTAVETAIATRFPTVFMAHIYHGTCISGTKRHGFPTPAPCERQLGPGCLLYYMPRRCGGINPLNMLRLYAEQRGHQALLPHYKAVVVTSQHMREEYRRHGVEEARLHCFPYTAFQQPDPEPPSLRPIEGRILMVGRLTDLKGGCTLLRAVPRTSELLGRALTLIVAGDGPDRPNMESLARHLGITVEFLGWVSAEKREQLMRQADVLAMPSIWPEPFGLVGIEAGAVGLPTVAFPVGGITDWLIPGVTGELAEGSLKPANLAAALARALSSPEHRRKLGEGAWHKSKEMSLEAHLSRIEPLLHLIAHTEKAKTSPIRIARDHGTIDRVVKRSQGREDALRIAVLNTYGRQVGGIEGYIAAVVPALTAAGHQVSFWSQLDGPEDRPTLNLGTEVTTHQLGHLERAAAVAQLRAWEPEVLYVHGFKDMELEQALQQVAPGVAFAHNYYGTCISGQKTNQLPSPRPCTRVFGPACLACYFPLHCGGWDPRTMWRLYQFESKRLQILRAYYGIMTASSHMREEYLRHGFPLDRTWHMPYLLPTKRMTDTKGHLPDRGGMGASLPWRLLFVGRFEPLKGGENLIQALSGLPKTLGRPIQMVFAGDGTARRAWEKLAARVKAQNAQLEIEFVGWVNPDHLPSLFATCHLLVVPSVWPEPFGLVGLEAGLHCLPAAAYAAGGIPDWLKDGVNGYLASASPATPQGLQEAIVRCLGNLESYERLCRGALVEAQRLTDLNGHVRTLCEYLRRAAHSQPGVSANVP